MADLDSFFAKKNKKKLKGKKFANPDDIARRLEDTEKKCETLSAKIEPKKLLEEVTPSETTNPTAEVPKKEEEEWKDYKDDHDHDLTDLKLSKLQIEDAEDNHGGHGSVDECDRGKKGDLSDGVWGKTAVAEVSPPAPVVEIKPLLVAQPTSYLPPHMRHGNTPVPRVGSRRNKQAPDIKNEMAFPSLGDVPVSTPNTPWSGNNKSRYARSDDVRYENSRYGSTRTVEYAAPRVNTANRFNALSDDRS